MAAKTTVKVALLTGAAKDDVFSDLLNEDMLQADLNVLANDPGSAKVVSIGMPSGSGQLAYHATGTSSMGAALVINPDGTIGYDGTSLGDSLQSLGVGESVTDTFTYVIRMANGALSTATVSVVLNGVNDPPTLASIEKATLYDTAAEDHPAPITGTLLGHDVDHNDQVSYLLTGGQPTGNPDEVAVTNSFGTLTLNTKTGEYHFDANADALNGLGKDATETLSFEVKAVDLHGATSSPQSIVIDLIGANDPASITGTYTGTVTEDGTLSAGGTLTVSDRDVGESGFQDVLDSSLTGTYGSFTFDKATGDWTYLLNNAATNVQALNSTDVVSDTLKVFSIDGTEQLITVTINGANELVNTSPVVITDVTFGQAFGVNKPQMIENFDSNDQLHLTGQITIKSVGLGDYVPADGNLQDSTEIVVMKGGDEGLVVLVGYTNFDTSAQIA